VVISLYTLTKFKSSLVELDVLVEMQGSGSFCHLSTNAVISGKMTPKMARFNIAYILQGSMSLSCDALSGNRSGFACSIIQLVGKVEL